MLPKKWVAPAGKDLPFFSPADTPVTLSVTPPLKLALSRMTDIVEVLEFGLVVIPITVANISFELSRWKFDAGGGGGPGGGGGGGGGATGGGGGPTGGGGGGGGTGGGGGGGGGDTVNEGREAQLLVSLDSATTPPTSAQKRIVCEPATACQARENCAEVAPAIREGTAGSVPSLPAVLVRQFGLSMQNLALEAPALLAPAFRTLAVKVTVSPT